MAKVLTMKPVRDSVSHPSRFIMSTVTIYDLSEKTKDLSMSTILLWLGVSPLLDALNLGKRLRYS